MKAKNVRPEAAFDRQQAREKIDDILDIARREQEADNIEFLAAVIFTGDGRVRFLQAGSAPTPVIIGCLELVKNDICRHELQEDREEEPVSTTRSDPRRSSN